MRQRISPEVLGTFTDGYMGLYQPKRNKMRRGAISSIAIEYNVLKVKFRISEHARLDDRMVVGWQVETHGMTQKWIYHLRLASSCVIHNEPDEGLAVVSELTDEVVILNRPDQGKINPQHLRNLAHWVALASAQH